MYAYLGTSTALFVQCETNLQNLELFELDVPIIVILYKRLTDVVNGVSRQ